MSLQSRQSWVLAGLLMVMGGPVARAGEAPFKPADTSSPRATLKSFIDSVNELSRLLKSDKYFDRSSTVHRPLAIRILDCLDTSKFPEYTRITLAGEAAVCLKETLDRVKLPPYDEIPGTDTIKAAGGMEKLDRWQIPGTRIVIAHVKEGPRKHEYLFTSGTLERAVDNYEDFKYLPYRTSGPEVSPGLHQWYFSSPGSPAIGELVNQLPAWAREQMIGQAAWKWIGLLLTILITLLVMWLAYRIQRALTMRWHGKWLLGYCLTLLFPIVAMLVPLAIRSVALDILTLRGTPLYVVSFSAELMILLAALVVVFAASNRITEVIIASPRIKPHGLDAQLVRIIAKLLSLLAVVIILLEGGRNLGIPVTTLLASAGIGGLAVALAMQDTLKNLFGTLNLMMDKSFRVGDRINVKGYDGLVEEIGLRSTKIRTFQTGHLVSIPNDELARCDIENIGRRPHMRRMTNLHLPLDTPRYQVEQALNIVRSALDSHEGMDPESPPLVYFDEFNTDSFNIRIIYWYAPPQYEKFLAVSEKINLRIFRAFEEQGIQFSLPARFTYWKHDAEQGPLEIQVLNGDGKELSREGSAMSPALLPDQLT